MGVMIEQFDVPVCNSFKAKVIKDQLCYTVDPNVYKDKINIKTTGLSIELFINYNEDRQITNSKNDSAEAKYNSVRIETIGKC